MTAIEEGIVNVVLVFLVHAVQQIACLVEVNIPFVPGFGLRKFHPKLLDVLAVRPHQGVEEAVSAAEGIDEPVIFIGLSHHVNHTVVDGSGGGTPGLSEQGELPRVAFVPREVEHRLRFPLLVHGEAVHGDTTEERVVIDDGVALGFPFVGNTQSIEAGFVVGFSHDKPSAVFSELRGDEGVEPLVAHIPHR